MSRVLLPQERQWPTNRPSCCFQAHQSPKSSFWGLRKCVTQRFVLSWVQIVFLVKRKTLLSSIFWILKSSEFGQKNIKYLDFLCIDFDHCHFSFLFFSLNVICKGQMLLCLQIRELHGIVAVSVIVEDKLVRLGICMAVVWKIYSVGVKVHFKYYPGTR